MTSTARTPDRPTAPQAPPASRRARRAASGVGNGVGGSNGAGHGAGDGAEGGNTIIDPQRAGQWRSQWEDVRMMFVDRPQDAVARADGLVGEVLEELSRTFTEQRSALDPNSLGGEPSTEEMRRAVQRYREFFDRLLTL